MTKGKEFVPDTMDLRMLIIGIVAIFSVVVMVIADVNATKTTCGHLGKRTPLRHSSTSSRNTTTRRSHDASSSSSSPEFSGGSSSSGGEDGSESSSRRRGGSESNNTNSGEGDEEDRESSSSSHFLTAWLNVFALLKLSWIPLVPLFLFFLCLYSCLDCLFPCSKDNDSTWFLWMTLAIFVAFHGVWTLIGAILIWGPSGCGNEIQPPEVGSIANAAVIVGFLELILDSVLLTLHWGCCKDVTSMMQSRGWVRTWSRPAGSRNTSSGGDAVEIPINDEERRENYVSESRDQREREKKKTREREPTATERDQLIASHLDNLDWKNYEGLGVTKK